MKIIFLNSLSCPGICYRFGDVLEVEDEEAKRLIAAGIAKPEKVVADKPVTAVKADKPATEVKADKTPSQKV